MILPPPAGRTARGQQRSNMGGTNVVLAAKLRATGQTALDWGLDWKRAAAVLALVAGGCLGGAFVLQYGFGVAPCDLCIRQRWIYAAILAMSLVIVVFIRDTETGAGMIAVCGLGGLTGFAFAFYQVGLEAHIWADLIGCTAPELTATNADEMLAQLMATPVVRCDVVAWSLGGISLAGYSAMIFMGMAAYAMATAIRTMLRLEAAR